MHVEKILNVLGKQTNIQKSKKDIRALNLILKQLIIKNKKYIKP